MNESLYELGILFQNFSWSSTGDEIATLLLLALLCNPETHFAEVSNGLVWTTIIYISVVWTDL